MATNRKGDVELVVSAKNEATQTINELVEALEKLSKEAGGSGIGGAFKRLFESSEQLEKQQDELTAALNRTAEAQKQLERAGADRDKDLKRQRDAIDQTEKSLAQLNAQYADYAAAANQARTPSENLVKTLDRQQKRQQELGETVEQTAKRLREAQSALDANGGVDSAAETRIRKQQESVLDLGRAWRETTEAVRQAQQVLAQRTEVRDSATQGQQAAQTRLDALREELQVARQLEKEKRKVVRESTEASDKEVAARDEAIAKTQRLKDAVAEQVLVERQARVERDAAAKSYREQNREVEKLVTQADRQKTAYQELKVSLEAFRREQTESGTTRQRENIERLGASLEKLQQQYEAAGERITRTQERLNKASGPSPAAVSKFEALKNKIAETEEEIREQTVVLERMEREYNQAGVSSEQLTRQQQELNQVTEELTQAQNRLQKETDDTAKATDRAGKEAQQAGRRFKVWGEDSRQALSFLQRIRGELLAIAAAYTGVFAIGEAVRSIYDAAVITEKATARLTARLGDDQGQIAEELGFVSEQADRLGISYGDLLDQYTRFLSAVPDGTLTLDQIKFSFQATAEAARVAGLSIADIQGVFVALSQLAGKGINLEDLRQQLQERIPGATEALRIGISELEGQFVSLEEVLERINKGELSGAAIVPLAIGLRRQFEEGLPTAVDSAQAALGRFRSELFRVRQSLAEAGFIDELVRGLGELTEQMRTPEFREGFQGLARGIVAALQVAVVLVKNLDDVLGVLGAILALKVGQYFTGVARSVLQFSSAVSGSGVGLVKYESRVKALTTSLRSLAASLLILPGVFAVAFQIGDQLQQQFPQVQKFGATLVAIFEKSIIEIRALWDTILVRLDAGWLELAKSIAGYIVTIIPRSMLGALKLVGGYLRAINEEAGRSLENFADKALSGLEGATDGILDKLVDSGNTDAVVADIRKKAAEESAAVDRIITDMFARIDELSGKVKVLDSEEAKKEVDRFGEEFEKTLQGLDFTRAGSNAGRSLGESLLTEFRNIQRSLEEEGASTLSQRLNVIRTEFDDFLESLNEFDTQNADTAVELRQKAEAEIAELRGRTSLSNEDREKRIAAIRLRTESQLNSLAEERAALSGARDTVNQLVKLRQQQEIQLDNERRVEETQERINTLVKQRRDEQARVNELADLGLITTEEQAARLETINTRSLTQIRAAVEAARTLAEETGNANLANLVEGFDGFEDIERRRAAVDALRQAEQDINDVLDLRNTRVDTLNNLRETGALDAATAEEQVRQVMNESNAELEKMVDNAIALARTLGDDQMVVRLQNLKSGLVQVNNQVFSGAQLSQDFASGFTGAFDAFIQGTQSAGEAFRSFIADFLRQIANAIIQALILQAITGSLTGGAGGVGGAVAGGLNAMFNHSGGVVGTHGSRRTVNPLVFLNAVRYHSGGVAGLKPDELPTILQKGEEVLTADDPRHRNNQGSSGQPSSVKIVNMIDSASVVSEGLNNAQGQKAIINFMRANKAQIKSVLT